jgi:hypothetical protein
VTPYAEAAVTRWLERLDSTTRADLRRRLKYEHRDGFDAATAELIAHGRIVAEPSLRGTRYRLAPAPPAPDPSRLRNQDRICDRCGTRKRRATGAHCGTCLAELARQETTNAQRR